MAKRQYDKPKCCKAAKGDGGVWWEPESREKDHKPGWTMIRNCSIEIRSYWLMNVVFCPFCGSVLPEE